MILLCGIRVAEVAEVVSPTGRSGDFRPPLCRRPPLGQAGEMEVKRTGQTVQRLRPTEGQKKRRRYGRLLSFRVSRKANALPMIQGGIANRKTASNTENRIRPIIREFFHHRRRTGRRCRKHPPRCRVEKRTVQANRHPRTRRRGRNGLTRNRVQP